MSDEAQAVDTAANIRRVALDLFARQGYDRSTLREIADALGISKAAVYYHYHTKVDILNDLLRPLVEAEERIVEGAEREAHLLVDPKWRAALVEKYIDLMLRYRPVVMYAVNDLAGVANSPLLPRMQRCESRLGKLLATGEMSIEQRVRSSAALGVIIAIVTLPDVAGEDLRPYLIEVTHDVLDIPVNT